MATTKDLREAAEINEIRSPKTDINYLYRFFNNTTLTIPTDLTGYAFEWELLNSYGQHLKSIIPVVTGNQFAIDIADTDKLFQSVNQYKRRLWVTFPDGKRKLWITGDYTLKYGEPDTQAGSTINVVINSQALTLNLSIVPYTIVQSGGASDYSQLTGTPDLTVYQNKTTLTTFQTEELTFDVDREGEIITQTADLNFTLASSGHNTQRSVYRIIQVNGNGGAINFTDDFNNVNVVSSSLTIILHFRYDPRTGKVTVVAEPEVDISVAGPTMTVSTSESSPTNTSPFQVTFTANEDVQDFVVGDITVGNGTAGNFQTVSPDVYTADITPTGQGAVTISVAQGVCTSIATSQSNQASNELSVTYETADVTAPTLQSATINAAGDTYTEVYDEPVTSTGTGRTLNGPTASINALTGGSGTNTLTFSLTGVAQQGEVYTIDYDSGTGDTADTATTPNDLASFSGTAVTNNSTQGGAGYSFTAGNFMIADSASEGVKITNNNLWPSLGNNQDQAFSVVLWVEHDSGDQKHYVKFTDSSGELYFRIDLNISPNFRLQARLQRSVGNLLWKQDNSSMIGGKKMIAVTYDGSATPGGLLLYLNDVSVGVTDASSGSYTGLPARSGDMVIELPQDGLDSSPVNIHNIRWFNRVLTPTEIADMATAEAGLDTLGGTLLTDCAQENQFNGDATAEIGVDGVEYGTVTYGTP